MHRFITPLQILLLAAMILSAAACAEDPASIPPPVVLPGPDEEIVYSKHIEPIFINSCGGAGCHMNGENLGGVALNSWEETMLGAVDGSTEVVPFMARKSHLFQHITIDTTLAPLATPRMPLGRDPLPREQVLAIKRWIDEGAKSDRGAVALADPGRARVFIAARNEDLVSVIDLATGLVARYIDAGDPSGSEPGASRSAGPFSVTLAPDARHLYVALSNCGRIRRYDARALTPLASADIGGSPGGIAITRDGATLYAAHGDHDFAWQSIARIDAATMRLIDTIGPVGLGTQDVVLSEDERSLYTINTEGDDISVIDLAGGVLTRRIPISFSNPLPPGAAARREPFHGVLAPGGRYLWVTCRRSGEVRVVDLHAGNVVDSIVVGVRPLLAALTPDGRELWVPNETTNSISIIDIAKRTISTTMTNLNGGPQAVGFTADGATAYVSCLSSEAGAQHGAGMQSGGVYMIRTRDYYPLRLVEIGAAAGGVGVGR